MSYKKKHKRGKHSLSGTITHKEMHEQFKRAAIETGKDIVIGAIGGGIVGVIIGKPSLLIGAGVTGYGHFANKPMARTFGMGMMMGGGFDTAKSLSGLSADEVKDRMLKFKDSFFSKLYLDKVFKKEEKQAQQKNNNENGTNGFGDVDLSELDKFEQQVLQKGADFHKQQQEENKSTEGIYSAKKEIESKSTEGMGASYAEMIDELPTHY